LEVRAPVAGIVLGLQVTTPRAVLRAAEPVLYLIPQDRPLVITARIAPIQIDEVAIGQPAELVFPAFSARDTPTLKGKVTLVSADALTDSQTGAIYYTAELQLDDGEQSRLGDRALLPGMPVEVFLQTGRRSPLAYLVQPFTDYFARAFRES
ncbi:MAG: HlyD family type I secretion periplasmic adaptor subunit, partial [Rhodobacter sp.]|nr:HlyD family type I secretion periplasmic adaptor subunit [Rhodobacter sp.]